MKNAKQIEYCCQSCGIKAMKRANLSFPEIMIATYRQGKCDWCGVMDSVTDVKKFMYPFTELDAQVAHWT